MPWLTSSPPAPRLAFVCSLQFKLRLDGGIFFPQETERGSGCCGHHCSLTDFEGLRNIEHKTPPRWRNKGEPFFSPPYKSLAPPPPPPPQKSFQSILVLGRGRAGGAKGGLWGDRGDGSLTHSPRHSLSLPTAQKGPRDSGNTSLTGAKLSVARPCPFAHAPSHTALPESAQRRIQWGPPSWKPWWGPADLVLPGCCPLPTCGGLFPPPCPWGSTSRRRKPPGGFPSSAVRGKVFFFLSITDGVLKITAKRNYSKKKIKRHTKQTPRFY